MNIFLYLLLPIICVLSAAFLAFHGISGWGWFLFIALFSTGIDVLKSIKSTK